MYSALIIPRRKNTVVRVFADGSELPGANVSADTGLVGKVGKNNLLTTTANETDIRTRLELAYPDLKLI